MNIDSIGKRNSNGIDSDRNDISVMLVIGTDDINPIIGLETFCFYYNLIKEGYDTIDFMENKIKIRYHFGSNTNLNEENWFIEDNKTYKW